MTDASTFAGPPQTEQARTHLRRPSLIDAKRAPASPVCHRGSWPLSPIVICSSKTETSRSATAESVW